MPADNSEIVDRISAAVNKLSPEGTVSTNAGLNGDDVIDTATTPTPEPQSDAPDSPQSAQPDDKVNEPAPVTPADYSAQKTLADIAEALEMPLAELYNVRVPLSGVDGEKRHTTLGQLKDVRQHADRVAAEQQKSEELREQLTQAVIDADAFAAELQTKSAENYGLVDHLEKDFMRKFAGVNWEQLRQENPGEWTALKLEADTAKEQINQYREIASQAYAQAQQAQQHAEAMAIEDAAAQFLPTFQAAIPDWHTGAGAKTRDYLQSLGYREADMRAVTDLRVLILADKARRFDEMQANAKTATKKLKKNGTRYNKPGARQAHANRHERASNAAMQRLRKTGHPDDAAEAIRLRLGR